MGKPQNRASNPQRCILCFCQMQIHTEPSCPCFYTLRQNSSQRLLHLLNKKTGKWHPNTWDHKGVGQLSNSGLWGTAHTAHYHYVSSFKSELKSKASSSAWKWGERRCRVFSLLSSHHQAGCCWGRFISSLLGRRKDPAGLLSRFGGSLQAPTSCVRFGALFPPHPPFCYMPSCPLPSQTPLVSSTACKVTQPRWCCKGWKELICPHKAAAARHMVAVCSRIHSPAPFFYLMGGRSDPRVAPQLDVKL